MDIIPEVQQAISCAKNIVAFEQEVAKILKRIGKTNYQAAIQNLQDAKISSNPKRELTLAIGHLQSAYQQFIATVPKGFSGFIISIFEDITYRYKTRSSEGYNNAYQTALLIALCYAALGERKLTERYLECTLNDFDSYSELIIDKLTAMALTATYVHIPEDSLKNMYISERHELIKTFDKIKKMSIKAKI